MGVLRMSVAGTVTLVLLGGLSGVVLAQSDSDESLGSQAFPTGTFVGVWYDWVRELDEDGTGRGTEDFPSYQAGSFQNEFTYAVDGDLFEQTSFNWVGEPPEDLLPSPPYRWQFDGEILTFEVVGEDPDYHRRAAYEQPHRFVPEPRLAVIAARDIEAGTTLRASHTKLQVVSRADVPPDTLTDHDSATGAITTMAIAEGRPVTPDMLEPPTE